LDLTKFTTVVDPQTMSIPPFRMSILRQVRRRSCSVCGSVELPWTDVERDG
jgi:hypothetical protein